MARDSRLPKDLEQDDLLDWTRSDAVASWSTPRPYYHVKLQKIIYIAPIQIMVSSNTEHWTELIPVKETEAMKVLYGSAKTVPEGN